MLYACIVALNAMKTSYLQPFTHFLRSKLEASLFTHYSQNTTKCSGAIKELH